MHCLHLQSRESCSCVLSGSPVPTTMFWSSVEPAWLWAPSGIRSCLCCCHCRRLMRRSQTGTACSSDSTSAAQPTRSFHLDSRGCSNEGISCRLACAMTWQLSQCCFLNRKKDQASISHPAYSKCALKYHRERWGSSPVYVADTSSLIYYTSWLHFLKWRVFEICYSICAKWSSDLQVVAYRS